MCKCDVLTTVEKYKYELKDLHENNSCNKYKILTGFVNEYIIFTSTNDYDGTKTAYSSHKRYKGLAMFFEVFGSYDFILKYFAVDETSQDVIQKFQPERITTEAVSNDLSTKKDFGKNFMVCKVHNRFFMEGNKFVDVVTHENRTFHYYDIKLSDYYVFENFVLITCNKDIDLISYINSQVDKEHKKFIYVILKVSDVRKYVDNEYWVVCTRYRCCDYREKVEKIQSVLNRFADNKKQSMTKTTFTSSSSCLVNKPLALLYETDFDYVEKRVLWGIKNDFPKVSDSLIWRTSKEESFYDNIKDESFYISGNKIPYSDLLKLVKRSNIYISYKRDGYTDGICVEESKKMFNWLKANDFSVHRDEEEMDYVEGFEKELSKSDYLIVCARKEYFKSTYCMYELTKFIKRRKRSTKPYLMLISNYVLIDDEKRDIITYWKEKKAREELRYNFKRIQTISENIESTIQAITKYVPILMTDKILNKKAINKVLTDLTRNVLKGRR